MRTTYLTLQLVSEDAMNRRQFLHAASMAAAGSVISGCYRNRPRASSLLSGTSCDLARVLVSPDREIRTVVGLRPYRPSGFVVKAEKLGEKLVIHNYGHGGAGITLSWGTSQLATALLPGESPAAVAVIGCGAVGLATARLLQDRGLPVTIYAATVILADPICAIASEFPTIRPIDRLPRTPVFCQHRR